MPKIKKFRELSRRQQNRRVKKMQPKEIFQFRFIHAQENRENHDVENVNDTPTLQIIRFPSHEVESNIEQQNYDRNSHNFVELTLNCGEQPVAKESMWHGFLANNTDSGKLCLQTQLILWADEWKIDKTSLTNLLKMLRSQGFEYLPKDGRTLMKTPRQTVVEERSGGRYYHYGLKKAIIDQLEQLQSPITLDNTIYINLNIDGLPVSKSSNSQLWPILGQIVSNELKTPFLIGAFHGNTKPNRENHFLSDFLNDYAELSTNGFDYNGRQWLIKIRAIICDAPARAFITCTKGHNGYFGCSKCTIEGDHNNHRMLFLETNYPLRTDKSFEDRETPDHHTGISPFETISIPMVTSFPLDYMHLVCLGQMKKMLKLWLKGPKNHEFRLSARGIKTLTTDMRHLRQYIPNEFVRMPTCFEELDRWKATEFRIFLLYLAPVLMGNHLSTNCMKHFMAFHCAIRILCDPNDYLTNNEYAENLLTYFVGNFAKFYGNENMVYTVHNLIHISADAKRFGPLDTFSAFPFENHLHSLKKLLKKYEKPLAQIHRRTSENIYASTFKDKKTSPTYPFLTKKKQLNYIPFECTELYEEIQFSNFKLKSSSQADRICFLKNNKIVEINFIGLKNRQPVIIGKECKKYQKFFGYPCDSRNLNIFLIEDDFTELKIFPASDIAKKGVKLPWKNKYCILPLLHSDLM